MSEAPNSQTQGGDLGGGGRGWGGVHHSAGESTSLCACRWRKADRSEEDSCCGCGGHQRRQRPPEGLPGLEPSSHGYLFSLDAEPFKQIKLFIENLNISMSYLVKI